MDADIEEKKEIKKPSDRQQQQEKRKHEHNPIDRWKPIPT